MKVRSIKLHDHNFGQQWTGEIENHWNYDDFLANRNWREKWISFDGIVYHRDQDKVYCGITSFDADIFKVWDRERQTFSDAGFGPVADPFDAKFHRSMQLTADGQTLYTATALLHDIDNFHQAPGGGIFKHDIVTGETTKLGVPIPHVYIQSIALDEQRGVIYSMHFTPERLSVFDLQTHRARDLGPIGSGMFMAQGENVKLDDQGCAWCGWGATRAWQNHWGPDAPRLCKYDPEADRIVYYQTGLPTRDGSDGFAKVEGLFNLGGGCLHASGDNGSLYRIDTDTAKAEYLGTPLADQPSRLTNLVMHSDGNAYGVTGRLGNCQVLRFNPRDGKHELIGDPLKDESGEPVWQIHDVSISPDGVLYAGENDIPHRSGYLWEISQFV